MKSKKTVRWLSTAALALLIFVFGYPLTGKSAENQIPVRLPLEVPPDSPLKLLDGFAIIPGTAVLVEGGYVVALFKNPRTDLYALVSFSADCDFQSCTIKDLVTYALFGQQETDPQFTQA